MGQGIIIKCKKCNYEFEAIEGIGMMFDDLMNVMDGLPEYMQKEIKQLVEQNNLLTYNSFFDSDRKDLLFENRIFVHPATGRMTVKLYVELYNPEAKELLYKTIYKTKGGKEYKMIRISDAKNMMCPKCKKQTLYESGPILWD